MPKFRKKPVVIEAVQFTPAAPLSLDKAPTWLVQAVFSGSVCYHQRGSLPLPYLTIQTLEGKMRADVGDWIIQGVKGEIYPCKPDIFDATYEAVPAA
jgi:hypothetical protein